MHDEIYLGDDGIVYDISHNDQTEEVATRAIVAMRAELANAGVPRLLVDLSDSGTVSREARQLYRDFTAELTSASARQPANICFAGGNPFIRTVVRFIVMAAGRRELIGFEDTREAAAAWLLSRGRDQAAS